jgi:hypothetical protein
MLQARQSVQPETATKTKKIFSGYENNSKSEFQRLLRVRLWSGRRTPSSLCRELNTNWGSINGWEKSALEGMMMALDPGWNKGEAEGIRLGKRIEGLIEKTVHVEQPQEVPQN